MNVKILALIGIVFIIAGIGLMWLNSPYVWKAKFDRDQPPPGGTSGTETPPQPPSSASTTPSCKPSWNYSGGLTVALTKNGNVIRRWDTKLAVTGGLADWRLKGTVNFALDTCGAEYGYAVVIFAIITKTGNVGSTTTTPTATSTWAPPNIQPPNRPPIVPLSIVGESRTVQLFATSGTSTGNITVNWNADLTNIIKSLGTGKYDVKVYAEMAYTASGHQARIYTDKIDIGTFVFDGQVITYEA